MQKAKTIIFLLLLIIISLTSGSKLEEQKPEIVKFYSPEKGVYVVDVDVKQCPDCIKPYVSDSLETVEKIGKKTKSLAAINAGFFDPTNTKTTSYVIENGQLVADPALNSNFIDNPNLKPYLPAFLNRSEFRIMDCNINFNNPRCFDIAQHNETSGSCKIIHSIQAGPELLPELKLEKEAFVVRKDGKIIRQSAGALGKYARSAVGIKQDHVLFVAVSNEKPMTLPELSDLMKKLGAIKAMAFDGGSSTSLYVNDKEKFVLTSAKDNAARRVKSVFLIKNQPYLE